MLFCFIASPGKAVPPEFTQHVAIQDVYDQFPGLGELVLSSGAIVWTDQDEEVTEPNDGATQAFMVSDGLQIRGHIDEATDPNDYFKVVFTERSSLFAELSWGGPAWLNGYIYNANIEPVTYLDEDTPSPKKLSLWQYGSGTFYIRVRAAEGASDYTLRIAIANQMAEPQNDSMDETDFEIDRNGERIRSVVCSSADPVDWFTLSIPLGCESASVMLDWFGSSIANLDFEIWDEDGAKVVTMAESTSYESLVSTNVPRGTYYIGVKTIAGRAMYQLSVKTDIDFPFGELMILSSGIWGPILY